MWQGRGLGPKSSGSTCHCTWQSRNVGGTGCLSQRGEGQFLLSNLLLCLGEKNHITPSPGLLELLSLGCYKLKTVGYELRTRRYELSGLRSGPQLTPTCSFHSHTGVHLHTEKQVGVGGTISQAASLLQVC